MHQQLLNASFRGSGKVKFMGIVRGEEKFAFLYVVISAVAVGCAMTYSWIAGLALLPTVLVLTGALIGAWATLFSVLEVRRLNQTPKNSTEGIAEEADPYASRAVAVGPPADEPCPHHEEYPESPGFDQGQRTSRLSGTTPLIDTFLDRQRNRKQKAAH